LIVFVVGAALLPVVPAAAKSITPQVSSAASAYTAVNPKRAMDTRDGTGGVAVAPLGPGGTVSLVVAPNAIAGVPANATAVVMNVTVTNTTAASFLTVYPTGGSVPFASNLNWVAGYTVPNLVTVQPGTGGSVTFFNKFGNTDVIADIAGYFAPPSGSAGGEVGTGFPQRLVDTRAGSGFQGAGSTLGAAATASYQVTGKAGVPATGVSAVILNSTVTDTTAASFLTLWAGAPAARNTVSNDNWVAGWTRANRAIVPVDLTTGKISVYNQFGSVDVILDVAGYFTDATASGKLFTAVTPVRLTDHQPLGAGGTFNLSVGGVAGVPLTASAAILDAVVSETTAPSFLTAFPTGGSAGTSDINWVAGQVNPNLTVTTLGTSGQATFFNSAGNVNVSVDLEGYFGGGAGVTVTANPTSLAADPTVTGPTSKVDVTVNDANGNPIALDPVSFTLTPSVAGSCGTGLTAQTTNGAGKIPQQTYKPSAVVGTCLITATEAIGAKTGSVTITQTAPPNAIAFTPNNAAGASIPVNANGAVQSFSTQTTNSATGAFIQNDNLTFTTSGGTACGTIGNILPAGGVSDATGHVTFDYTASSTVGFCTVTATESKTGSTKSVLVTQRAPAGTNSSALTATPPTTILANGTDTVALTDTVTGTAGISSDGVTFGLTPSVTGACGSVSPSSGATTSGGVLTTTYTASTTAGTCNVTAFEANGGTSSSVLITQNPVPNKVTVTANPASISATTSSTSALTVTVTNGVSGAPVVGDAVSFSATAPAADPAGACGAISGNSTPTNASGQVTATYTGSAIVGFCTITATDTSSGGGSGKVRITQTNPASAALVTTVTATPASVPADGGASTTTSAIVATVKTSGGTLVNGDHVQWTLTPSTAGACPGTPGSADTISGQVTFTYTPTITVGTCTITATEANSGSSGSATVTQTVVGNTVTFGTLTATQAEGGGASSVVANVKHLGVNVASDLVTFTTGGGAACGVFNPTSATTPANPGTTGNASTNYTPSLTVGFCTVTATDATGASVSATITQTTNPASANAIAVVAGALTPNTQANGANTATITATVTLANVAGDPVRFILTNAVPGSGACGSISPTSGVTNGSGVITATYTVSTKPGTCNITATEANGGVTSAAAPVASTARPFNITLTANPTAVSTSGGGTSTLTVTVTDANTAAGHSGDHITFVLAPQNGAGSCGSLSGVTPGTANTDSNGVVTATYTSGATIGSCLITATEADSVPNQSANVTITQTA
jgi:hypothetical protein